MQIMTSEERIFLANNMAEHINSITSIFFLLSFTKKVLFFFFLIDCSNTVSKLQ